MILGLYYISLEKTGEPGEGMMFADMDEIEHALTANMVTLHSKIVTRFETVDEEGNPVRQRVETTPGRMMLANLLPKNHKIGFDIVNRVLRKREVGEVIDTVYRHCGQKESVIFCDRIMTLGFTQAFKAGISFGKDDMVIPEAKWRIVEGTRSQVAEFEQQYQDGLITQGEKYNKVVDAWAKCTDQVADAMMGEIKAVKVDEATGREMEPNSVYMMSHSGARGSPTQMRQLAAMRGLMAKPSGEIIETPIISNFKEGLTVGEYFNSTHGARKGLADTALKTANSGYLTRRLVDVAQDCIVVMEDCGTEQGITVEPVVDGGDVVASLGERVLGRTANEDVVHPISGEVIVERGQLIEERDAAALEEAGVASVYIRSALTCELQDGICAACYGRDLARGTPVNTGEAVGIIAAQSIGEPGTQLTMRTFHIGGAANVADNSFMEATQPGIVEIRNRNTLTDRAGAVIVMGRNVQIAVKDEQGNERATYKLIYGSRLLVKEGEEIARGQRLAEWDPYTLPIIAEAPGVARLVDLTPGFSVREEVDEATGISQRIVSDWRAAPKGQRAQARDLGDGDAGRWRPGDRGRASAERQPGALLHVGRRHPFGRGRAGGAGRRRARPYPPRVRQDQGHHRRSAAGGRAVRGPPAEGPRGHRRDRRPCPLRQGLQEQAPHHHRADRRVAGAQGIPPAERQAHRGAGGRLHPEGRVSARRQPGPA
jgi:DNA-directed RNA polymerase subunit beta'